MKHTRLIAIYVSLFAVLLFTGASAVHAQTVVGSQSGLKCVGGTCTYTPLEPLPTGDASAQNGKNFPAFVSGLFRVLLSFGALFAVVMLVVAGIGYMLSESALDIDKAKDRAKAALWGLLLLAGSWLILNTINPDLLKFQIVVPTNNNPIAAPATITGPTGAAPVTCLDSSCLSAQQQVSLQNAQQLQQSGTINSTLSNDVINQTIQDKQNIAAGEATTCTNGNGQVYMGAMFNNGCSPGAIQAAQQTGFAKCTPMAAGGVCLSN